MDHQSLGPVYDELIDARDGMGTNFRAGVPEKLKKLGYHNVEWAI